MHCMLCLMMMYIIKWYYSFIIYTIVAANTINVASFVHIVCVHVATVAVCGHVHLLLYQTHLYVYKY